MCPGSYPEQVTITQPLTLRGVQAGNAANPTITAPPGGLAKTVISGSDLVSYYQLLAQGTASGSVNISNIGIDGSNSRVPNGSPIVGVYYQNASGKVNKMAIYDQFGSGDGWGVVLESTNGSAIAITVLENSIHDFDSGGIGVSGNVVAAVKANDVVTSSSFSGSAASAGIVLYASGTVTGNRVISHPQAPGISAGAGITVQSNITVTNNTVEGFTIGIWPLGDSNKIMSNRVSQVGLGIAVNGSNNDVENNHLVSLTDSGEGIGLNCSSSGNLVIHNNINDAFWGIINPHNSDTFAPNTFSNVAKILSPPC